MSTLLQVFELVLENSVRSVVVLTLLLVLRPVLRGHLPANLLFVAWIAVALGLLLPGGIPVGWGADRIGRPLVQSFRPNHADNEVAMAAPEGTRGAEKPVRLIAPAARSVSSRIIRMNTKTAPAVVWLTVALGLGILRVGSAVAFWRRVRAGAREMDPRLGEIVRQVASALKIRGRIATIESRVVSAPAVSGCWTPTLLFPAGFAGKVDEAELRWVVLHELGHWKRRDSWAHGVLAWARIVHWFNPLLWVSVGALRLDCELACDEFVMRRADQETLSDYGAVLLKVLSFTRGIPRASAAVGIFESKQQLKHRIQMIANYRNSSTARVLVGAAFVVTLSLISLTRESKAQGSASAPAITSPAATHSAAVPSITQTPPAGWFVNGTHPQSYMVGLDATQGHITPVSSYIKSTEPDIPGFGGMMQTFSAKDFRGKRVRFSAWIKTAAVSKSANLWMRIDGEEGILRFDNIQNRAPSGTKDWKHFEAVLDVSDQALSINIGFFVSGTGQAWFNDAKFEVVDPSLAETSMPVAMRKAKERPAGPENLSFETGS